MKRNSEKWLTTWYNKENRKPLLIRGARQVGKSYLVRQFARNLGVPLYEINLEKHYRLDSVFATFDLRRIIQECEFICGANPLDNGKKGILFLDEIQAAPNAIAALRYFFEEKPELPVVAAGSLLEFALSNHRFSMPVGRIEFYYLGPMTFQEFLQAHGEEQLVKYLNNFRIGDAPSETAHDRLVERMREYLLVGGMPEAVGEFVKTRSFQSIASVHESIVETYRADFAKYAALDDLARLRRVFEYVPSAIGEKFKYVNVDPSSRAHQIRAAFDLLALAGLMTPVKHSSASGLPLAALADDAVFKPLFLDVGLMNAISGIRTLDPDAFRSTRFVNEGKMAEQFVGQHLLNAREGVRPALFYWLREGKKNNAEVDYLMQSNASVIPVEVKAGKTGSLKSLHRFVAEKKSALAVRFDLDRPSLATVDCSVTIDEKRNNVKFDLLSLPLYMVEQCARLAESGLRK